MTKKYLTEETIEIGVRNGIWAFISDLVLPTLLCLILVLSLVFYDGYRTTQYEKKNCGGQSCPVSAQSNCDYTGVVCNILIYSNQYCGSESGGKCYANTGRYFCGYQEANSYFQIYQNNHKELNNLTLECN